MLYKIYIEHANQTILWNTIKNVGILNEVFHDEANKIAWFKSIIEMFYTSIPKGQPYIPSELNLKNKETIAYMVENLKLRMVQNSKMTTRSMPPQQPQGQSLVSSSVGSSMQNRFSESNTPTPIYSRNNSNRNDSFLANVTERQKEYDSMNKKPLPPSEDIFENKIEDTAISNMDELIKQHMKQREEEIAMYAQQPGMSMPSPAGGAPPLLSIMDTSSVKDNSNDAPLRLKPANSLGEPHEKKVVWATDILNSIMELKTEIAEIKTMLSNLPQIINSSNENLKNMN